MGPKNKLTHAHKLKINHLYQNGWKVFAIQNELKKYGVFVTWAAVKNVITQHEIGNLRVVQKTAKKHLVFKTLTNNDLKIIQDNLEKDFTTSARELKRKLERQGRELSLNTVRRAVRATGYCASQPRYCQMIREPNNQKRAEFCSNLINADERFDDVIFSDECSIQLHHKKSVSYRKENSCAPMKCQPKHPLKIHLWGAISKMGPSPLVTFDGVMDATFYVETILAENLLPFTRIAFPDGHRFIQDNDPKHRSKKAKEFMEINGINWVATWPSGTSSNVFYICRRLDWNLGRSGICLDQIRIITFCRPK